MALWWIGNAVSLLVFLPLVAFLFRRILGAVFRIRAAIDQILVDGVSLIGDLDELPETLDNTRNIVGEVSIGAQRYENSINSLL